jgi:phosphoserine phosphatase
LGKDATQRRYIINILGETLTAVQLSAVAQIMSPKFKYLCHQRLTGRVSVVEKRSSPFLRTIIRGGHCVDKSLMTASFMEFLEL